MLLFTSISTEFHPKTEVEACMRTSSWARRGGVYEAFLHVRKLNLGWHFVGDCLAENSGFIRAMAGVHSAV